MTPGRMSQTLTSIPCRACGGKMLTAKAPRFGGAVRIAAAIIGAPSLIAALIYGYMAIAAVLTVSGPSRIEKEPPRIVQTLPGETPVQKLNRIQREQEFTQKAQEMGEGIGRGIVGYLGMRFGAYCLGALIAVLICCALLSKKKVWRCQNCGAFIDRL